MYPPLRVFDVVTKSASFALPGEGVAHPSPYLYIDSTAAEVDATIDAGTFIYAAELVIVKLGGSNPAAIVAPGDWLTPGATLLPTFDTADFGASWRVLIDGITKVVIVLSAPSGGGGGSGSFLLKFSGTLDMGTNSADAYGDYPGDTGRGAGQVGYPIPHASTFTALYLSRTTNTANQPQSYIILKNGAPTSLILPGQVGGVTGVSHIGAQSVGFAENDLLDFAAAPDSGGGSGTVEFSAMLIGSVDA
jgi:hypothetical protein